MTEWLWDLRHAAGVFLLVWWVAALIHFFRGNAYQDFGERLKTLTIVWCFAFVLFLGCWLTWGPR